MAILGKDNIVEMARTHKAPYWRIYESEAKRSNGNYVSSADFDNLNIGLEESLDSLRKSLGMLSSGRYLFVAYTSADKKKGGIDAWVEIESSGNNSAISGFTSGSGNGESSFVVEGIGRITPDNFNDVIDLKIKKMVEEQNRQNELKALKEKISTLEREKRENDGAFNKGIMSIGAIAYGIVSKTKDGKEFIGLVRDTVISGRKNDNRQQQKPTDVTHEEVSSSQVDEDRIVSVLERLQKDNPALVDQLAKLADLKENDPDMFNNAIGMLNEM